MLPVTNSFELSDESQKILNKYQEYKESGYAPTPTKTSTNTQQISQNSNPSQQNINNKNGVNFEGSQSWIIIGIVIILIVAVVAGATRGGGSRPWGSYSNPPSMKQLWRLRQSGYDGPMPTSSREAHERISDIESGGDGIIERDEDDDYDVGHSRY
jgi:hypothetical protein